MAALYVRPHRSETSSSLPFSPARISLRVDQYRGEPQVGRDYPVNRGRPSNNLTARWQTPGSASVALAPIVGEVVPYRSAQTHIAANSNVNMATATPRQTLSFPLRMICPFPGSA